MTNKQRDIIFVVGKTGFGKSYFVKNRVAPFYPRLVIFDIKNEYHTFEDFPIAQQFTIFEDVEVFRNYMLEHFNDNTLKIILRFSVTADNDLMNDYETSLEICFAAENMTVIIEEISNFASPHYYTPLLEQLLRFGRHHNLSLVCTSQRVGDVGSLLLNNADYLCVFRLSDSNDIKRLQQLSYVDDTKALQVGLLEQTQYMLFENI